jgi:hypothetical protein
MAHVVGGLGRTGAAGWPGHKFSNKPTMGCRGQRLLVVVPYCHVTVG